METGIVIPRGRAELRVIQNPVPDGALTLADVRRYGSPQKGLDEEVNEWRYENFPKLWKDAKKVFRALKIIKLAKVPLMGAYAQLSLRVFREDGRVQNFGLASFRVVTDTGVGFIVDAFQNLVEAENMKYHGIGTGTNAEAAGDTALQTELTTQYNPDSTRATGSLTEGATANIFKTVGTNAVDASVSITEHGILSQSATGGGVLLDRSKFTAIALASGDSLESTYQLTLTSGG